jgi:hypothetical protein
MSLASWLGLNLIATHETNKSAEVAIDNEPQGEKYCPARNQDQENRQDDSSGCHLGSRGLGRSTINGRIAFGSAKSGR